jgi:hypothetical protein
MATTDKPYGDVEYADPEDGKYPIDTEAHCRAAWSYVNMPKNAAVLGDKLAAVKARIKAACKKFGIEISDDNARSVSSDNVERRLTYVRVEVRAAGGEDGGRQIGGYAAVFNRDSRNLGTFVERVAPSFFSEDRAAGWPGVGAGVACRYNHSDMHLLGTTSSGTLRLAVDGKGLDYTVDVPECRSDVWELTGRGDVAGSSFAFAVDPGGEEWSHNDVGVTQRTLLGGKLVDVAPVGGALAAYPDATVALRSLAHFKDVPEADVFALAAQHELRRLFVRTDIAPPTPAADIPAAEPAEAPQLELDLPQPMSPAVALMHILGRRAHDPIKTTS